jgi:hypothetical protein
VQTHMFLLTEDSEETRTQQQIYVYFFDGG